MPVAEGYLPSLLLTLAVEVPLVALYFSGMRARLAATAALATTLTHLCMHFVLFDLLGPRRFLPAGETLAFVAEALVYAHVSRSTAASGNLSRALTRGLLASALANTASFAAGWALL
jgi:hypothetical protein